MPAADEIRVGLVGLGAVCEGVHYPGFSRIPGVQIGAICDSNADLVQKRALDWGIPLAFSEYGEFLSKSGVDAVAIATPNVRHCDQVHQALDANCHVICEKTAGYELRRSDRNASCGGAVAETSHGCFYLQAGSRHEVPQTAHPRGHFGGRQARAISTTAGLGRILDRVATV